MLEQDYLDIEQAAAELGVSRATVWNLVRRHGLTRYRVPARGKKTLLSRAEVAGLRRPVPLAPLDADQRPPTAAQGH